MKNAVQQTYANSVLPLHEKAEFNATNAVNVENATSIGEHYEQEKTAKMESDISKRRLPANLKASR